MKFEVFLSGLHAQTSIEHYSEIYIQVLRLKIEILSVSSSGVYPDLISTIVSSFSIQKDRNCKGGFTASRMTTKAEIKRA
jgi:hypothetical protein